MTSARERRPTWQTSAQSVPQGVGDAGEPWAAPACALVYAHCAPPPRSSMSAQLANLTGGRVPRVARCLRQLTLIAAQLLHRTAACPLHETQRFTLTRRPTFRLVRLGSDERLACASRQRRRRPGPGRRTGAMLTTGRLGYRLRAAQPLRAASEPQRKRCTSRARVKALGSATLRRTRITGQA